MLEIYLIRHGLTLWNLQKRFQGQTDITLSEEGIKQAEATRDRLRELHFDEIYASDLKRAFRTAEIIAEPHALEVKPVPGFREIMMGDWEGLKGDDIRNRYPEIFEVWKTKPTQAQIPNCEGVINAARRAFLTFVDLAKIHQNDTRILIVAHGLINSTILTQIHQRSLDDWYEMRQGNTAVNILIYDGKEFQPILINCTKHCDNSQGIR